MFPERNSDHKQNNKMGQQVGGWRWHSAPCLEVGYVSNTPGTGEERQLARRLPHSSLLPSILPSKQVERPTLGKGRIIGITCCSAYGLW